MMIYPFRLLLIFNIFIPYNIVIDYFLILLHLNILIFFITLQLSHKRPFLRHFFLVLGYETIFAHYTVS